MKYAKDFRGSARDALRGKWPIAVGVGLVASLLCGNGTSSPRIEFNFNNINNANADTDISAGFSELFSELGSVWGVLAPILGVALLVGLLFSAAFFILGSIVGVGYAKFNLGLIDKKNVSFSDLFSYFSDWKSAVLTNLLSAIYVFLWSLLFISPGIIASYSYAMTDYILSEDPTLSAGEAVSRSKEMMRGNRFRLFCLHISFIGWDILCAFTFGIGNLFLNPYKKAAIADFYREISETRTVVSTDSEEMQSEF